jgi:two-component system sensor histidine kinase KdpD
MRGKRRTKKRKLFAFSWRDACITGFILSAATLIAMLVQVLDGNYRDVPMIFILAVLLISRYTHGYLYGTAGSLIGVVLVNYMFTYPYFAINFTLSGYPITFVCMLVASIMTSALTTQIKQQENLRVEAEKEKMRANLLRSVSHDLRTPLTSILGTTSALLDDSEMLPKEKQRELLSEAHEDAEWLIRMVENLLSITRMSGGEAKITKTTEAVEEIVSEAVRKFKKRFPDAGVSVSVPGELLMVPMDAILIEQVIINLLENSVLHGKAKDGIWVMVEKTEKEAVFTVSDHGVGIPNNVFEHLFDGYLSGMEENESDSTRNMGIGLSVCMSIIRAHGGEMHAENRPEGGAAFHFSLPLA